MTVLMNELSWPEYRACLGDEPDIDVLDPAHAPGTGTPEIAGMTTREPPNMLWPNF